MEFSAEHVANIPGAVNRADAERTLRMFAHICRPVGVRAVSYGMVEAFSRHLRDAGKATATRNKRLRYLRAALNRAVKRGYIVKNPMDDWEWEREEEKAPRVLTADEKNKLLQACPTDQWRTFVFVALTTGCRRGELLELTWGRVDFVNASLLITNTKAKRDRVQPLNPATVTALRRLQASTLADGGPFMSMLRTNVPERFRAIVKTAGIKRCTVHDLRRTFCTDLARLGINQLVVQRLAGHAAAATTARYYQWVDDAMKREAIERLGA
jgi:integrase